MMIMGPKSRTLYARKYKLRHTTTTFRGGMVAPTQILCGVFDGLAFSRRTARLCNAIPLHLTAKLAVTYEYSLKSVQKMSIDFVESTSNDKNVEPGTDPGFTMPESISVLFHIARK